MGTVAFAAWVASALTFVALLYVHTPRATTIFAAFDFQLPTLTELLLRLGNALRSNEGLLVAAGVLTATLLPFALGFCLKQAVKLYGAAALLALTGIGLTWLGLIQPLDVLAEQLNSSPPPGR